MAPAQTTSNNYIQAGDYLKRESILKRVLALKTLWEKLEIVVKGLEAEKMKYRRQQRKIGRFLHLGIIPPVTVRLPFHQG